MGPYLEWNLRAPQAARRSASCPTTVVELGSGVGANLRYLPAGGTLVAIEPNPHMHRRLRAAAERRGVHLELRDRVAEHTGLPDHSVDSVISSLVLCSVTDPAAVLAEIRRILRPGGTYRFVEHVAAPGRHAHPRRCSERSAVRGRGRSRAARANGIWSGLIRAAGFARVDIEPYRLHTPVRPLQHPDRRRRPRLTGGRPSRAGPCGHAARPSPVRQAVTGGIASVRAASTTTASAGFSSCPDIPATTGTNGSSSTSTPAISSSTASPQNGTYTGL